jgi:sarcosine oxidase, subunit alpha
MKRRIVKHPILDVPDRKEVAFHWNGLEVKGYEGEMISSALIASGIHIFGHHAKDGSSQGIFCANGQCSQCLVIADGLPVKSCMTPLQEGMALESLEGLPKLPEDDEAPLLREAPVRHAEVLVIGGGPAGLSAAIELGKLGIDTLILDDKQKLGGKLLLQTHKFFGSVEDSHAGTRGFEIARMLEENVRNFASVDVWLNTTAVGGKTPRSNRRKGKDAFLPGEHAARGLRRRSLPNPGQPGSGESFGKSFDCGRRQCGPYRRIPRDPGGD